MSLVLILLVLLGDLPGAEAAHELGVVVGLLHHDGTLALEDVLQLGAHVLAGLGGLLLLNCRPQLLRLLQVFPALGDLVLEDELLALLLDDPGVVERGKLPFEVVDKQGLLLLGHLLVLVASLEFVLVLLDT